MVMTPVNEIIREVDGEQLIGESPAIQQVIQDIALLAPFDEVTVVLQGETGTGKDLVARLIHANSPRRDHPFVSINCASIPDGLLESECFGSTKWAYTGAQQRAGQCRQAEGGTLFLNELQDASRCHQAKWKEVVESKRLRPVGSDQTVKLNVRFLIASNTALDQMVADGRMARDFRERLGHAVISIPSLRERREDIPALVEHFLAQLSRKHRMPAKRVTTEALQVLRHYSWPGNVRELQKVLEAAGLKCAGTTLDADDITRTLHPWDEPGQAAGANHDHTETLMRTIEEQGLKGVTKAQERAVMEQLLTTSASLRAAARRANLRLSTLQYKIKTLGLEDRIPHPDRSHGRNTNLRSTK